MLKSTVVYVKTKNNRLKGISVKKICLIILFLSMIWLVPAGALAAEGADVEVSVAWAEAQKGDEVELAITVNSEKKIQGAMFYLDYDEGQLELLDAYSKESEGNALFTINVANKMVGYARLKPVVLSNKALVYAKFRVLSLDPGSVAAVSIRDPEFGDENEMPLTVSVNAGGIKNPAAAVPASSPDQSQAVPGTSQSPAVPSAESSTTANPPEQSMPPASQPAESSLDQSQTDSGTAQESQQRESTTAEDGSAVSTTAETPPVESSTVQGQTAESTAQGSEPAESAAQESDPAESSTAQTQTQTSSAAAQTTRSREDASAGSASEESSTKESAGTPEQKGESTTAPTPPADNPSPSSGDGSGKLLLIGGVALLVLGGAFILGKKVLCK